MALLEAGGPYVIPVRHHSPACARLVQRTIEAIGPAVVLVEGPSDANHLLPALLDERTRPPVALMAYSRTESRAAGGRGAREARALFYPFCEYSPEWVALRSGSALGAEVRLCDLPASRMLLEEETDEAVTPNLNFSIPEGVVPHEEWWEATIEGADHPPDVLVELLRVYAEEMTGDGDAITRERERCMWDAVTAASARVGPGRVVLVCGAAHAVQFPAPPPGPAETRPRRPAAVQFTITPYTFAHLARKSGYGAGNLSPLLLQRVWALGDLKKASAATLSEAARSLRDRGWNSSTADVIAAQVTAEQLGSLRGKPAPGAREIVQAASTVWAEHPHELRLLLSELIVGSSVGTVSEGAGASPLVADFSQRAARFWRVMDGVERESRLRVTLKAEREQSCFLHQLRVGGIEFAHLAARRGSPGTAAVLWTGYEVWQRRWTHLSAISLAEKSPLAATVRDLALYTLGTRLAHSPALMDSVSMLLDAALCGMEELLAAALEQVDAAAIDLAPWEVLGESAVRLDRLNGFPGVPAAVAAAAASAAGRLAARALLRLPEAASCSEERAPGLGRSLIAFHEAVQAGTLVEPAGWARVLLDLCESSTASPYLAGLAAALLQGSLQDAELVRLLAFRLSVGPEAALFLEGLLALNRRVLLRAPALVSAVQHFVAGLSPDAFVQALPALRRTFGGLGPEDLRVLTGALEPFLFSGELDEPVRIGLQTSLAEFETVIARALEDGMKQANPDRMAAAARSLRLALADAASVEGAETRPAAAVLEKRLETLEANPSSPGGLLAAQESFETVRLSALETRPTGLVPTPGLSLVAPLESHQDSQEWQPPDLNEAVMQVLSDDRSETRSARVRVVAVAASLQADANEDLLEPLLAHGDYHVLLCQAFAGPDAARADRCLRSDNPLIRRAGINIAASIVAPRDEGFSIRGGADAVQASSDPQEDLAIGILVRGLAEDRIWPQSLIALRKVPARLLDWLQRQPWRPAEVASTAAGETWMARLTAALQQHSPASRWLEECLGGPDRLALEASVSLALLGRLNEEELFWSARSRPGGTAARSILRWEIESGARSVEALVEAPFDDELAGMLSDRACRKLYELWAAAEGSRLLSLVEWAAGTGCCRAAVLLLPLLSASSPLTAAAAAEALGRIGDPRASGALMQRTARRGSDVDLAILRAIGMIGDLRMAPWIRRRLSTIRPEDTLSEEFSALRSLGETGVVCLVPWLEDPSLTVRAVAAALLEWGSPTVAAGWLNGVSAEERLRVRCAISLAARNAECDGLVQAAAPLGNRSIPILVAALRVSAGPAEEGLAGALEKLRLPASILPLLNIPREGGWKRSIPAAIGDAAVPQLAAALRESEPYVARAALNALQEIGSPAALRAIQRGPGGAGD